MERRSFGILAVVAALVISGCGGESGPENEIIPDRPVYGEWIKVEIPGTVCGNGSQYKFFVRYSDTTNKLVVAFEPGGACWDHASCSGKAGIRGAANPDGIPDDHYKWAPLMSPFLHPEDPDSPTPDWNHVWIPYCTGDVHTGNSVTTYVDPDGVEPDLTFHHVGHQNMVKVIEWLDQTFQTVPKLLVTGCSAGGAGSLANYYFVRKGMRGVERGYLLDDSGPIFPSSGWSKPLHDKIREAWNVDSILTDLPAQFDPEDYGTINTAVADEFPDDRLSVTFFRRDYNYSLYSYERFYDYPDKETIHDMWWDDTQLLMEQYDTRDNLGYFIPYWRNLTDSHCTTVITFANSNIEEAGVTMVDYIHHLLDDSQPLESYVESVQPDEDVD